MSELRRPVFLSSTPVTVLPETSGLRVVLVRPAGLAMSFVYRGLPLDGLAVHVSVRPAKGEGRGWSGTADEFGKIVMADLPPGPVRVEVFVSEPTTSAEVSFRRDPLTVVGPIELPAGDVCRERSLNSFDLASVVRRILLRVETEEGLPASEVDAAVVETDPSFNGSWLQGNTAFFKNRRASFAARTGKDGVIRLYAPNGPRDVAVAGWDLVPVLIRNVAAEDVVRLRKSRPLTVVLRGATAGAASDGADRVVVETDCPADPGDERSAIRIFRAAHPTSAEFSAAGAGAVRYRIVRGDAARGKRSDAAWRDGVIKADAAGRLTLTIDDY